MSLEDNARDTQKKVEICDRCKFLLRLPVPNHDDWFLELDDVNVVCVYKHKIIAENLRPENVENIKRPEWCPLNQKNK